MTDSAHHDDLDRRHDEWVAWARSEGLEVPRDPGFRLAFRRVLEGSDFVAQSLQRDPALLGRLLGSGDLDRSLGAGALAKRLGEHLSGVHSEPTLAVVLRRFRREQMVRIIWRDLSDRAPLAETLADLSALADTCIAQALERLYAWAVRELGAPRDGSGAVQQLVVIGMGKLGARELNLSSDIDLIFAFPSHGRTDGTRPLTNEQFFIRLAQRLVQMLSAQSVDGFVFRVDTRLRPFGDSGPLAMGFDAMEDYYQSQAREWERYAMIKARFVAGDPAAGARLMDMLRPFVYRRYLDFGAIESLREMKSLIAQELKRKGMADNVKLGPGGIREIEFIGQAFQLIRGGRDPDLQIRPILAVLRVLAARQLLSGEAARDLSAAYEFLRRVENRLQAWKDQQTHVLPHTEEGRRRLARAMGYGDWVAFAGDLDGHRRSVQGHFDDLFAAPEAEDRPAVSLFGGLWDGDLGGEEALARLAEAGLQAPEAAHDRLVKFRSVAERRGLSTRGWERLNRLMPRLLQALSGCGAPDQALPRVLKILEAVVQRTAYLALLHENPVALTQLVRLAGLSPWISDQLERHPLLLDELLDPQRLYAPLRRRDLEAELDVVMGALDEGDLEQQMERLRLFSQSNMLRVAAADLTGVLPLMVVSDYLTEIAEVTLERVLNLAWTHLVGRHGRPAHGAGDGRGFVVIGYGKLGGIELGYRSDLDLVFLHGGESVAAMTDGDRPVASDVFFARLGQRMIHMLTTQTPSGVLYEVDMRLRPDGAKGLLVRSLRSFAEYQAADAWTWEHQALVRARPVAGDPEMARRFNAVRRDILTRPRDADELRSQVSSMRAKMREQLDKSRQGEFDLKQGAGGIADIEFMVQFCVLRWASEYPDLVQWTDNIRLLETLSRLELIPGRSAAALADAYRALRAAYHRCTLMDAPTVIGDDALASERARVQDLWAHLLGG